MHNPVRRETENARDGLTDKAEADAQIKNPILFLSKKRIAPCSYKNRVLFVTAGFNHLGPLRFCFNSAFATNVSAHRPFIRTHKVSDELFVTRSWSTIKCQGRYAGIPKKEYFWGVEKDILKNTGYTRTG